MTAAAFATERGTRVRGVGERAEYVIGPRPVADRATSLVRSLPSVDLGRLMDDAELQTRVDRKYLVTMPVLTALISQLAGSVAVLDIAGRRVFGYSSAYFDTADLRCFREHRQGRRRRFKVRTRTYIDSGQCMLEVKTVAARGESVKERRDYPLDEAGHLTRAARSFVGDVLADDVVTNRLRPALTTDYHRMTLLDRSACSRITIDVGLRFSDSEHDFAAPQRTVIIETKTSGPAGAADRILRRLGSRPQSVSKYCVGIALLHPELSANRWHRAIRRHFL